MKVKTSELIGSALDWAIATLEKKPIRHDPMALKIGKPAGYWVWPEEFPPKGGYLLIGGSYSPSTNPAQGYPIIVQKGISTSPDTGIDWWIAHQGSLYIEYGPTPLIAAMRCCATSELGDEIEIPDVLLV